MPPNRELKNLSVSAAPDHQSMAVDGGAAFKAPPSRAVTRRQTQVRKNTYTDLNQAVESIEDIEAQTEYNETLSKETFLGVK